MRPERSDIAARRSQLNVASGCNFVLGLWIVLSPFLWGDVTGAAQWNGIIFGVLILVFAWMRRAHPARSQTLSWWNAIFGVWLIIGPFALQYGAAGAVWNSVFSGLLVVALGAWSGSLGRIPRAARESGIMR